MVWILIVVVGFIALEAPAIMDSDRGDTLSEWVWHLLFYPVFAVPFTILWFGGLVWLTIHFFRKYKKW